MVTWGDVLPISKATLPFPISVWHQWSLLLGQGHDVTVGSGAGGEVAPAACTVVQTQGLPLLSQSCSSHSTACPPPCSPPPPPPTPAPAASKSTVALIYVGMWLLKTGTRPNVAVTKSSVIVKKEQAAYVPAALCQHFFFPGSTSS